MKFVLVLCHCSVIRNRITRDALIMHHTSSNNINGIFSHSERVVWRAANCGKSADRNRINRWMPASGPEKVDSSGGVFVPRQVCFFLYFLLIALSLSLLLSRSPAPFLSLRSCLSVPVSPSLSCCPCLAAPVSLFLSRRPYGGDGGGGGGEGVTVTTAVVVVVVMEWQWWCTMGQIKEKHRTHPIVTDPRARERVKWAHEQANEWVQRSTRANQAVWSKKMSERCEQMSEWTSEWPSLDSWWAVVTSGM